MSCVKLKGQSTLEYVILLGFVVAALIAMGIYMKRGSEGQLREATDRVGAQYEAGKTTGTYHEETTAVDHEKLEYGGHIITTIGVTGPDTQKKSGNENVEAMPAENTPTP